MIKIEVIGHLGHDARQQEITTRQTEEVRQVLNFSLAHTSKYGVNEGKTTWISCSFWNPGQNLKDYLRKGSRVYLEGEPGTRVYTNKEGHAQAELTLNVTNLVLLDSTKPKD